MALIVKPRFGHDLEELRRDLESVETGLGKLIAEVGRRKLAPLVAEVQGLMPFDPAHRGWPPGDQGKRDPRDPGHIRDSIKGGLSRSRFTVYTTHPGGPVHWWGGTIRPKQNIITIRQQAGAGEDFVSKTAEEVVGNIDDALNRLMRRHGL